MSNDIYIKPADGLLVRDPQTREPLPPEGDWKADSSYWRRRLAENDVTLAKPPKAVKADKEVIS